MDFCLHTNLNVEFVLADFPQLRLLATYCVNKVTFERIRTVREITKSSSTFSATNISSNMIGFFQLHDTIKMKSNHTGINYNHNDITIRSHMMIYNSVYLIFATKFSSIHLAKDKNGWFFNYHLLTCSVRKMVFIYLMQNIDMCLLYKSHQIARLVSHLINHFSKWMSTV